MSWKRRVPDAGGEVRARGLRVSQGVLVAEALGQEVGRFWTGVGRPWVYRFRLAGFATVLVLLTWGVLRPDGPHEPFQHAAVLLHVLAFFALGLSARYAFDRIPAYGVWLPLLFTAPALEYLQAFVQPQSRTFSTLDIAGNLAGIALAMLVWPMLRKVLQDAGRPIG